MSSADPQSRSLFCFMLFSHHPGLRDRRGLTPALELDARRFLAPDFLFQLPGVLPLVCM